MWRSASVLGLMMLSAAAGSAQEVLQSEALVGCYVLTLGEWVPAMREGNRRYQTPPDTLRLSGEVGGADGSPFEEGKNLVRPVIDQGRTPSAYWSREGSSAVRVTWTNGFTGVRMKLTPDGHADLAGVAEAFTDVMGPAVPTTGATLRRVGCAERVLEG